MSGRVALVGAGPGDPELLTLRAARLLADADLVLYDALVSPETVALAPRAQRFCVGKRAGRPSVRQETIHAVMIRAKGGDPFVLGRGGEEALALAAAGVPFEVVPGVSSAVAAPALAGIPVTHRGLSTACVVVSGHDESAWRPPLEGLAPGAATVVVLMGLAARGAIAAHLVSRGWPGATPAAVVWAAGTPRAERWLGRLDALGAAVPPRPTADPGAVVVGAVVGLAEAIAPSVGEEEGGRRAHAR